MIEWQYELFSVKLTVLFCSYKVFWPPEWLVWNDYPMIMPTGTCFSLQRGIGRLKRVCGWCKHTGTSIIWSPNPQRVLVYHASMYNKWNKKLKIDVELDQIGGKQCLTQTKNYWYCKLVYIRLLAPLFRTAYETRHNILVPYKVITYPSI